MKPHEPKHPLHDKLFGRQWKAASAQFLVEHPLCEWCEQRGRTVKATVVHHDPPHRYDPERFWDVSSWHALDKRCHDAHGQRQDKGGYLRGSDRHGMPTDPDHHWNRE